MKRISFLLILVLICIAGVVFIQFNTQKINKLYKEKAGPVILDKETVSLFKEGKVKGVPFSLDDFPVKQVKKNGEVLMNRLITKTFKIMYMKKMDRKSSSM